jgi:hypothetical protein
MAMSTGLRAELLTEIDAALIEQRMIEAIRIYRQETGVTLAEARDFVEVRQRALGPLRLLEAGAAVATLPGDVQRYLDSGHARKGELFGWWRSPRADWCVLVRYANEPQAMFEIGVFPPAIGHWGHDLHGLRCTAIELAAALDGGGFAGAEWDGPKIVAELRQRLRGISSTSDSASKLRATPRPSCSTVFVLDGACFERDWLCLIPPLDPVWWAPRRLRVANDAELIELAGLLPGRYLEQGNSAIECSSEAGPMLWALCHEECLRESVQAQSSDTLFADIESHPPDWRGLSIGTRPAWNTLLALVDIAARRRDALPWWLQAAAEYSTASIGLLGPSDTRRLSQCATELLDLFVDRPEQPDIAACLKLCSRAAQESHWLLGWEAGT